MNPRAAFAASYADFKLVKTRGVAQIISEIPLEKAAEFIRAFGIPDPKAEIPIALARLKPQAIDETEAPAPKDKQRFDELPPTTQSVLTCKEPKFWAFLREEQNYVCHSEAEAANAVRAWCGVESRSEIKRDTPAAHKLHFLLSAYRGWQAAEQAGA